MAVNTRQLKEVKSKATTSGPKASMLPRGPMPLTLFGSLWLPKLHILSRITSFQEGHIMYIPTSKPKKCPLLVERENYT